MKSRRQVARLAALSRSPIIGTLGTIIDGLSIIHHSNSF